MKAQRFIIALIVAFGGVPRIALATEDFKTFIGAVTAASAPLGSGDLVPVIQGGVTKYFAGNTISTLNGSQTITNHTINGNSNTLTVIAATQLSGLVPTANGGLNLSSGTSGGILCATSSSVYAWSAALTANAPIVGAGAGVCPGSGSSTGNTTKFVSNTGSITTGHGGAWDASGNWIDNANAVFTNVAATFTAPLTVAETHGTLNTQAGTTYTILTSDCGKQILFTNASAIAVTLPGTIAAPCAMEVGQAGTGQITFSLGSGALGNGAGGPANPQGFTKTFGKDARIGIEVDSNSGGSAAHWVLTGNGA